MPEPRTLRGAGGLLAAALSLPALQLAHAEAVPDAGTLSLKYLSYQDSQPGADRIRVTTPALAIMVPFADAWSLDASHVVDTISGASPAYHTEALTKMHDRRRATDLALTHYADTGTVTLGTSYSSESDYISRGLNLAATRASEDQNTTWSGAVNLLHDSINPSNRIVFDEHKNVADLSLGLTQVLTMRDLVQLVAGYSHGNGYFSDPYKIFDNRPRTRNHLTLLGRWNHHLEASGGTARLSYRYYDDSFKIRAHTFTADYVQPFGEGWTITPLARYYSQSAASFYVDLDPAAAPFPTNPPPDARYFTEEQRLSAYGAVTLGAKLAKQIDANWSVDLKAERYRQRASWMLGGAGSPNLAPFSAVTYQLGLARRF